MQRAGTRENCHTLAGIENLSGTLAIASPYVSTLLGLPNEAISVLRLALVGAAFHFLFQACCGVIRSCGSSLAKPCAPEPTPLVVCAHTDGLVSIVPAVTPAAACRNVRREELISPSRLLFYCCPSNRRRSGGGWSLRVGIM